jgi:hypothetical protein
VALREFWAAELVFWSWLAVFGRIFWVGRSCSVLGFLQVVVALVVAGCVCGGCVDA